MTMRFCLPRVQGRGAGLGNELINWSRSFLAAQVLGARSLPPAFGLNSRRYWRHFGTSRLDWLAQRALVTALPVIEFGEADYIAHGSGDVLRAFRSFARQRGLFERYGYVVVTEGMWGGYRHVQAARTFVKSVLYKSRFAPRNLTSLHERLDAGKPVVGMHVRMGDFATAVDPRAYRGRFNTSVPLDWYRRIAEQIIEKLGSDVQFLIASDGTTEQLQPLTHGLPCVLTSDFPDSDCSDLLALSQVDLLICSTSSFSAWAAFLSDAPYLWYEPNLQIHRQGYLSIWGHEANQQLPTGETRRALQAWEGDSNRLPRGFALSHEGRVPETALTAMMDRFRRADAFADLVQYGVVPVSNDGRAQVPRSGIDQEEGVL